MHLAETNGNLKILGWVPILIDSVSRIRGDIDQVAFSDQSNIVEAFWIKSSEGHGGNHRTRRIRVDETEMGQVLKFKHLGSTDVSAKLESSLPLREEEHVIVYCFTHISIPVVSYVEPPSSKE